MSDTMMPDKMNWDDIRALYRKARQCFFGSKKSFSQWKLEQDEGWFYLWSAYHYAAAAGEQDADHLVYARILAMMDHEMMCSLSCRIC